MRKRLLIGLLTAGLVLQSSPVSALAASPDAAGKSIAEATDQVSGGQTEDAQPGGKEIPDGAGENPGGTGENPDGAEGRRRRPGAIRKIRTAGRKRHPGAVRKIRTAARKKTQMTAREIRTTERKRHRTAGR